MPSLEARDTPSASPGSRVWYADFASPVRDNAAVARSFARRRGAARFPVPSPRLERFVLGSRRAEGGNAVLADSGPGVRRMLLGSIAEKVVRHATVPVLTVHARDSNETGATA
jgi:universal stress protein family protein